MPAAPPAIFTPPSAGVSSSVDPVEVVALGGDLAGDGELLPLVPLLYAGEEESHSVYEGGDWRVAWRFYDASWALTYVGLTGSYEWLAVSDVAQPWLVTNWEPQEDASGTPVFGVGPTPPVAIFTPSGGGGSPSAPPAIQEDPMDGGAPDAPGAIFTPVSGGGSPGGPQAIFTPPERGGYVAGPPPIFGMPATLLLSGDAIVMGGDTIVFTPAQ